MCVKTNLETDLPRDLNLLRLIAFGKFDLALFQRLVQSSQLLAAHHMIRVPVTVVLQMRYLWLALSTASVPFRIFERS